MVSFRDAVPPTNPADMAVLAQQMKLNRPVSLRNLIGDLRPPTAILIYTGHVSLSIAGGNLAGSATWILNAQGYWNFSGNLNNSSFVSLQYGFGMALDVKDMNGNFLGVMQADSIGPGLLGFNNNASWNQTSYDQRIVDLWPEIFGARTAPPYPTLKAFTDPGDIAEAILEGLGALLGIGVIAILAVVGARHLVCDPNPSISPTESGSGMDLKWTCTTD